MSKKSFNDRIAALDGWRGISILLVVNGHLLGWRFSMNPGSSDPSISHTLMGWGVDIFFSISGYIITRLALTEYDATGKFSILAFYIRRFFRIIPAFYLYLGFVFIAALGGFITQDLSKLIYAASFTCNFQMECGWFIQHAWSLAFEEQFYIVFPALFVLLGKHYWIGVSAIFSFLMVFPALRYFLHMDDEVSRMVSNFAPTFSFICAGSVMAVFDHRVRRLMQGRYALYISCAVVAALIGLALCNGLFSFPLASKGQYIRFALNNLMLPICFAWLVGMAVHQSNAVTRLLEHPALQFFGRISYSLYLWQMVFVAAPDLYPRISPLLFPPFMVVMAMLSYHVIERPSMRLGRQILDYRETKRLKLAM